MGLIVLGKSALGSEYDIVPGIADNELNGSTILAFTEEMRYDPPLVSIGLGVTTQPELKETWMIQELSPTAE